MDKNLILNYSLDSIDIVQGDERFSKVRLHAFGDGENAHTMPVSLENLKKTADTIYNIPIVVQFTNYNYDGIGTHSQDEIPVGFVYTDNNPVEFEYDEKHDKTYLTINGLLWNKYTNNIVDIIRDSNGTKKVSVEMRINDYKDNITTGKPDILDWTYYAITILSDEVREACKGSNIQLMEFSKDKDEYMGINFSNDIQINNSRDFAISSKWTNPKRKLFNPIINAHNSEELLKEAYLVADFSEDEYQMAKFDCPHHIIMGGNMFIHKDGLQMALKKAIKQGIMFGEVKEHLVKHYKELGMNNTNYAEFGIDRKCFEQCFAEEFNMNEGVNMEEETMTERQKVDAIVSSASGYPLDSEDNSAEAGVEMSSVEQNDKNMAEEEVVEKNTSEEKVIEESVENSDCNKMTVEESSEDSSNESDSAVASETNEEMSIDVDESADEGIVSNSDDENDIDDHDDKDDDSDDKDDDINDADDDNDSKDMACGSKSNEMSLEEAMSEIKRLSDENAQLKSDNEVYMSKLAAMSDYEELKEFKRMADEAQAKEEKMSQVNAIMSQISERGINMSDEDKNYLLSKVEDYDDMSVWANMAKAVVFDKYDMVNSDVQRIGMPYQTDKVSHSASVWDRIKNKF